MVKRTLIILLTLFAICPLATSDAWALPNIDKLADAGKFEEVIAVCDKSIRQSPKDAKAFGIRGWAKYRLSRFEQGIEDCNRAIQLDCNYARAYRYRASMFFHLKRYKDAIADCNKSIALDPTGDEFAYEERGLTYGCLNEYDKSIADLTTAINLSHGTRPEYFGDRGFAYECANKNKQAIEDFDTQLRFQPKNAWAHWQKGQAYFFWGHEGEAINSCNVAIALDPKMADAYMTRYWILMREHKYKLALMDARKMLDLKGEYRFVMLDMARMNNELGNFDEALKNCNQFISSNPNYAYGYDQRAKILLHFKRYEDCIADLSRAAQLSPKAFKANIRKARAYENLAFICADLKMHSEREELLNKAIAIELKTPEPTNPNFDSALSHYLYCRGVARFELAKYKEAIEDFNSVIKIGTNFDDFAYHKRALAEFRLGKLDQAMIDCNAAIPRIPEAYETRAEINDKQGKPVVAQFDRLYGYFAKLIRNLSFQHNLL